MKFEFNGEKNEKIFQEEMEISLDSEKDLLKMENWLKKLVGDEEAEQCVFVLRSMIEIDFINQCSEATKEFGKRLAERFGEEESFFDLAPDAEFSDVRSSRHLSKTSYRGDYHSVGLLEFKPAEKLPFSLVFDLTYGNVVRRGNRKAVLAIYSQGSRTQALEKLRNHYGGLWEVELEFDKQSEKFVFPKDRKK